MLKPVYSILFAFFVAILAVGCAGEDGDPGPEGAQGPQGEQGTPGENGDKGDPGESAVVKVGTFEGKYVGTRRDGVPFEVPFSYEYSEYETTGFMEQNGQAELTIHRNAGPGAHSYFYMSLIKNEDGTLTPQPTYGIDFRHVSELDASTLFQLDGVAYMEKIDPIVLPISQLNNLRYQFSSSGTSYYNSSMNGESVYRFSAYVSNTSIDVGYSDNDGALYGLYDWRTDTYIQSGELFDRYNELKFVHSDDLGEMAFVDAESSELLGESLDEIPADEFTITNYVHDSETGVLSFDFTVKISGYALESRENSSLHDLTINGHYNSGTKVYANSVGRSAN